MRNSLKNFGCGFAPDPAPDALVTLCSPAQQAPWGSMVPPAKKTLASMFYNMLIRSLDRNPQNSGEVFQNAENRVWGRFQNVWKNIHPWFNFNFLDY